MNKRFILISLFKLLKIASVVFFVKSNSDSILLQVAFSSACLEIIVLVLSIMDFASELRLAKFNSNIETIEPICTFVFSVIVLIEERTVSWFFRD